jgi:hypothetical protein
MKRILALVTSAIALAACASPLAPTAPPDQSQISQAQSGLKTASKTPTTPSGRLASN